MCFLVLLSTVFITACFYLYFFYRKADVTKILLFLLIINLLFLEGGSAPFELINCFHFFHHVFQFPSLLFCINPFHSLDRHLVEPGYHDADSSLTISRDAGIFLCHRLQKNTPTFLIQPHSQISCDESHVFLSHYLFQPSWAMAAGRHFSLSIHQDVITGFLLLSRQALLLLAPIRVLM